MLYAGVRWARTHPAPTRNWKTILDEYMRALYVIGSKAKLISKHLLVYKGNPYISPTSKAKLGVKCKKGRRHNCRRIDTLCLFLGKLQISRQLAKMAARMACP